MPLLNFIVNLCRASVNLAYESSAVPDVVTII